MASRSLASSSRPCSFYQHLGIDEDAITPAPAPAPAAAAAAAAPGYPASEPTPTAAAVMPSTLPRRHQHNHHDYHHTSSASSSTTPSPSSSRRSSMSGLAPPPNGSSAGLDAAQLWERMLSVQRVFGCYNSARMRAALEAEDREVVCQLRPSSATLDLLNDSVSQLNEETKEQVEKYLYGPSKRRRSFGKMKH